MSNGISALATGSPLPEKLGFLHEIDGPFHTGLKKARLINVENVRAHGATGNGTSSDFTAIHRARDAASTGGTVFFPDGTYLINDVLRANVTGQKWLLSPGATIKLANSHSNPVVVAITATFTLEGGKLDGNKANQSVTGTAMALIQTTAVDGITFRNVIFQDGKEYGIRATTGSTRIVVEGCYFTGITSTNVYLNSTNHFSAVRNNQFQDTGGDGVHIPSGSTDCIVMGNTFDNVGRMAVEIQGSSHRCLVANNVINGADTSMGISLSGSNQCAAFGNIVRDAVAYGIELVSGSGLRCVGNEIDTVAKDGAAGGFGIVANATTSAVVSGNTVRAPASHGIVVEGASENVTVANNSVNDTPASSIGIYVGLSGTPANVAVSGNTTRDTGADGIRVTGNRISVTGNSVLDPGTNGLSCVGGSDITFTGNQAYQTTGVANGDGFEIANSPAYVMLTGNRARGFAGSPARGLLISATATNVSAMDNDFRGNTTAVLDSSGVAELRNNLPQSQYVATAKWQAGA